jgi:hypothetical protein
MSQLNCFCAEGGVRLVDIGLQWHTELSACNTCWLCLLVVGLLRVSLVLALAPDACWVTLLACGMLPALEIDGWVPQAAMAAFFLTSHGCGWCLLFVCCDSGNRKLWWPGSAVGAGGVLLAPWWWQQHGAHQGGALHINQSSR